MEENPQKQKRGRPKLDPEKRIVNFDGKRIKTDYSAVAHLPLPPGVTVTKDSEGKVTGYYLNGTKICAAKRWDADAMCLAPAGPTGRCYTHGGRRARGKDHYNFQTGFYSRYLPDSVLTRYQQALNDPDLVSLRSNLALTETRMSQLLERLETSDTLEYWQRLQSWFVHFQSQTQEQQLSLLPTLHDLVNAALDDYKAWQQIQQISEDKRKLAESERRRLLDMQQYITVERAMLLVSTVVSVVRKYVTDDETLQQISGGVERLLTLDASPTTPSKIPRSD